jgi:hypothetical protein
MNRAPKRIKYHGQLYTRKTAGAFGSHMQRIFRLQDQLVTTLDEMKGLIHYRVRGQGSTKGPGLPSAGEEASLTPQQKQQAEKLERDIEQLKRSVNRLLPADFPGEVEQLDKFMGFTS